MDAVCGRGKSTVGLVNHRKLKKTAKGKQREVREMLRLIRDMCG